MNRTPARAPALLALVALLALAPPATAQEPPTAWVRLDGTLGSWNGASGALLPDGAEGALLWVPPGARIQLVHADGESVAWRSAGSDALRVDAPLGARVVEARYDFAPSGLALATVRAPADAALLELEVRAPEGRVPVGAPFEARDDGRHVAELRDVRAGDAWSLRVVPPDRVGELPVVAAIALLAALAFALTLLWHRIRPPLPRREGDLTFVDHLAELQARLLPPALAFVALNAVFFTTGLRVVHARGVPLVAPALTVQGSLATRAFEALAERQVPAAVQLVALRPVDAVLAQVQLALFLAFVAVLPLLLYEIAAFLAPGLLPRERRLALRSLPLVAALFVAGAAFGYLVMSPLMIRTLYGFAPHVGALPLLGVGELVTFVLLVVLAFGLAFELPVAMYLLARLGLVRAATFRRYVRHAVVVIVLASGILTPDPSIVSQLMVALPVTGLYVVGIVAAAVGERRHARRVAGAAASV